MKYSLWMQVTNALNVITPSFQTRLASARHALRLYVAIAINFIVKQYNHISFSVRIAVLRRERRKLLAQLMKQQKSLIGLGTSTEKTGSSMTTKPKPRKKYAWEDNRPLYICGSCARRKHLKKAAKVWVREGKCSYCLDRCYVCQIIEYVEIDATVAH